MKILYELTEEDVDIYLNAEDVHLTTDQKATLLSKLEEEFSALDEFHQAIDNILEDMSEAPDFEGEACAWCGQPIPANGGIDVYLDSLWVSREVCSETCKREWEANVAKIFGEKKE